MNIDIDFDKAASIRKTVAIEFTNYSVRILQLESAANGLKVRSFSEIEVGGNDIRDGIIANPGAVALKVQEAFQSSKPQRPNTGYVICLIPQHHTFITTADFPDLDKKELREIVSYKAAESIPLPLDQVYWDWHRLGKHENGSSNKTKVQIAAVPRKLIDSYMQTLQIAKLEPLLFEPCASAANRLAQREEPVLANGTSILIHIAGDYAVLSLAHQDGVVFSTQVMLDTNQDVERANIIYRKTLEVSRYAQGKLKVEESQIKVLVYGIPTRVANIVPILSGALDQLKVGEITYKHDPQILEFISKQRVDNYVSLIGGAIRGLGGQDESSSLNLIPQIAKDIFTQREMRNRIRGYMSFLAIDVALVALALLLSSLQLNNRLTGLENQYESIQTITNSKRISAIAGSIDKVNNTTAQFKQLIDQTYDWQKLLNILNSETTTDITITNLAVIPEIDRANKAVGWELTITGISTKDRESVINFLENLRKSNILTDVKLPLDDLETDENVTFTIEAKMPLANLKEKTNAR